MKKIKTYMISKKKFFPFALLFLSIFISSSYHSKNYNDDLKLNSTITESYTLNSLKTHEFDSWVGNYKYYEFVEPNINLSMQIEIYKENGNYFARIEINGFQIYEDMVAQITGNENKICLKYVHNNLSDSIIKRTEGETLLCLRTEGGVLLTDWDTIKPYIIENQISGKERFIRVTECN